MKVWDWTSDLHLHSLAAPKIVLLWPLIGRSHSYKLEVTGALLLLEDQDSGKETLCWKVQRYLNPRGLLSDGDRRSWDLQKKYFHPKLPNVPDNGQENGQPNGLGHFGPVQFEQSEALDQ